MKECDKRKKPYKQQISSNNVTHPVTKTYTTLHSTSPSYTSLHFTQLHFTPLHFTTFSFGLTPSAPFHLPKILTLTGSNSRTVSIRRPRIKRDHNVP